LHNFHGINSKFKKNIFLQVFSSAFFIRVCPIFTGIEWLCNNMW
jgi:hypothetical protein